MPEQTTEVAAPAPAAPAPAAPAQTTLELTLAEQGEKAAADAAKVADAAAAKAEAERVAALSPEAKAAEDAAKAKADADAATKAEETRRAALTPEARKAEDEAKAKADAEAKANAVPEKYEFQVPEGVKVDEAVTAEFSALAKELGLSQEKAQKVYDIGVKSAQSNAQAQAAQVAETQATWLEAAKADKEFGGENLKANMAIAAKAMAFATPEMKTILNESKLGNHPEIVRWMYRVGKAMSEDSYTSGRERLAAAGDVDAARAQKLYPGMNP